jgi:hypothetical protein
MPLGRVSDEAGKVALGLVGMVEVPQLWSQWHPSVSTYRGGDWPDMETSYLYASLISWGESVAFGGLVSWIIGEWWPLIGVIVLCLIAQFFYGWFVHHPAPGNPRAAKNGQVQSVSQATMFSPIFSAG